MSTYGRNFEFRVPPMHGQRGGRYVAPSDADLPMGVPVVVADGAEPDALGLLPVELATGAQDPKKGLCGIAIYEHGIGIDRANRDPWLNTFSDYDTIPRGKACQVISGDMIKVVLRNTEDRTFLNVREYTGRVMVAGLGATPTLQVGDMLTPGTGDDDDGYWAETSTASEAWLIVEKVEASRSAVECRLAF